MLSRFILLMFPNKTLFNTPASFVLLLPLLLICWCIGVSQEEVILNEEINLDVSLGQNSSPIRNYQKGPNKLGNILHQNHATTAATTRTTRIITSQVATRPYYNNIQKQIFSSYGNKVLLTEKRKDKIKDVADGINNNTCGDDSGCNSHGSETVPKKQEKHITESSVPLSENKDVLQKDDVHIKIIDTDARRKRDRSPFHRWWSRRNRRRYWSPSRRDRKWWKRNRRRWRQRPNMTTPLPTSTALVDTETGDRRVIITRPGHQERPSQNQTGGSTSISQRKGYAYWNVPPVVLQMKRKLEYKIRQMSNMVYNGLSETLYNITRRSKYIVNKHSALKEDASQLISDTHDEIEDIVELNNNIYDTVLSISAFHRRLYERLYEQGPSPTPGAIPNITALVKKGYSGLNREALILLRTMKHMRNKFFHLNHTYAKHISYYYDRLDRIRDVISSHRIRIGDLMDMAMYVNNQMSNLTRLKVPSVLREIYDERHKLTTVNYQSRHQLHVTEQVHQDVTTFQKSCQLRLQELSQFNYTILKTLPKPTTTPLTLKEKRKLQILVNRVKGHTENVLKTAAEIDSLLPPVITSAKELILKLSMESQSDSYKVWALGKILKQWDKISSAVHGNTGRRKWMKTRRQRIRRMRKRMPKSKPLISKRKKREAEALEEDIDKIYEEIIHTLTQIIKRLDAMWMKLFGVSSGNIGEHLQSIVSASLSRSKKQLKISRNLVNDVQDIKSSLAEVKAKKRKLENNVNKSEEAVSLYHELVSNATEMRRLINETEQKINDSQEKCLAAQKLADLVLADKDELERLLEVKKKEKEKERKEKEANKKDKDNEKVSKKKKRKKLKDKSNDNVVDLNGRKEKEEKRRKDKDEDNDRRVEVDASKKELEENERTKAELKALIEKYLRLQKEEDEEKRKNEERGKKKKITNVESEEVEDKKERKTKKRRRKKNRRDDLRKKNHQRKESGDEQRNKQERNKTGKRRKEDDDVPSKSGETVEGKRKKKKKKLTENGKNENDVNKVTDENTEKETKKKFSEIDVNSVLEIKKNLEDVLKKLDQKLEGSKNWSQRQRRKRRRRRKIELASKKRDKKRNRNKGVMGDKEMINDKETSKELNEKEESGNEDKKKKRRKVKNEGEDRKADADEEVIENLEESWKTNSTEKKSRKKDINEETNEKEVKKNKRKRKEKNNDSKKKRKKHTNDKNTVTEEEKNIKERGKGEEVKEKKEKKVRDEENREKKVRQKNLNEKEKSNEGERKKDKNSFEEDTESNVKRRKKKRKLVTKEENKKRDKMKVKEKGKKETDDEKEHQKKDLQEEKRNIVKNRKRKDGRKKENDITDSIENNSKDREKNDLMKEKEEKKKETGKRNKEKKEPDGISKDSEEHRKKRRKHKKNKEEGREKERKKKRKEVTENSLYIKNQKDVNETKIEEEMKGKEKKKKDIDKGELDLDDKKKEILKKRKKSNNSTMMRMSLVEEGKVTRDGGRSRKFHRRRKKILNSKLRSPPIFIQEEEQNFAKDMKNKSKQIEEDVKKSKMAMESIVKHLKELFPGPCTSISNNINQLRLNVSQIRQKIQLARTIVSSMKIPVSLNGQQHVEMTLNQKTESREIQTSVEICIKPRTTNSVILSLQANNSISYSLALVDSKPLLTILDVNGEMLKKLEPDTKLIKNNWYQFLIHRNGRNFSLSVNPKGSKYERITVQKFIPDFTPEQIPLSLVSLGGYPENFPISNSENLKGCIAYLNVNGHSTRIFSPLKSGLYPSVCKTDCEYFTNTSMVFEGNGFALLESDVFKKPFTLVHLTFKTFQKNALLMSIKSNSKMLLLVTLIEGNIHVERKGKTSSIAKQSQGTEFSNGRPHSIQVTVIKNELEIKTSSEEVEFEDKDASGDEMLFDEGISLGGLASSVRNESKYRSFIGCLSNVSIDSTPLNLLYLKDGRHVYQGDCQGNVWLSCAQFTEPSVPVTLIKYDHVRSISLMVSAQAQGVALFFERKEKFSIKLQLTTTSLEVFNYINDENEIIPKKNGSGFWHLLHIEDQEGNIHITLDGEQSVDMAYKANTGWFYSNANDFSMLVTVGGLPKDHQHFKKLDTFIGSVSSLFIQQLPLDLNKEFGSSNNLSVCAKPPGELFTSKLNCINSIGG